MMIATAIHKSYIKYKFDIEFVDMKALLILEGLCVGECLIGEKVNWDEWRVGR